MVRVAQALDGRERARLVLLDKPRVADDVGRQDGGEAPLDAGRCQDSALRSRSVRSSSTHSHSGALIRRRRRRADYGISTAAPCSRPSRRSASARLASASG